MQLCAITDEISQDFEHALDVLQEYGVEACELRGLWGVNIAELDDEATERAQTALRRRRMRVACLATPFYKCDLEPHLSGDAAELGPMHGAAMRDRSRQMDILRRCAVLARRFETRLLRVFSFWRKDALTPDLETRIAEAFREPVQVAEREGLLLALENEHACYIGTGAEAARLVKAVGSDHLRIVWDPGNAFYAGETPYPDGYDAVRGLYAHVHVKDARMVETAHHGRQPQWCIIGEGEIDYPGQFAALRRDAYGGYLSLETHFVPERGTGEGGKGVAEDGSRACLTALQQLLTQ